MTVYSKLLPYTCYELGHTWHHSCSKTSFDMFISAGLASLKIYAVVYLLTALLSKKKITKEYAIELLKNYLQSSYFLALNGSFYVASFCVLRRLFGHINFLTASWIPGFMASYIAIYAERPSRRSLLAIYVSNVASECLWNVLKARGYVTPIPKGEVLIFATTMMIFGYYFKATSNFGSLINSILKFLLGKDESGVGRLPEAKLTKPSQSNQYTNKWKHKLCPHRGPCITNMIKMGASGGIKGYLFDVCFRLLTSFPKLLKNPLLLSRILFSKSAFGTAAFIAWFSSAFKGTCCAARWITNEEKAIHGAYAGGLAAIGVLFNPSSSLVFYSLWKAIETLYSKGIKAEYLPVIPGGIEFLYAFSTGYLFHLAALENFNMKPSYWRFLLTLTSGKFAEYNKTLLNCYGLDSGRIQVWPSYDKKYLSEAFIKKYYKEI